MVIVYPDPDDCDDQGEESFCGAGCGYIEAGHLRMVGGSEWIEIGDNILILDI